MESSQQLEPKARPSAKSAKDNYRAEIDLENDIVAAIRKYEATRKRKTVVEVNLTREGRAYLEVDCKVVAA